MGKSDSLICDMSIFIHVASNNVRAMLKSIYNTGNFTCDMPNLINDMCKFICYAAFEMSFVQFYMQNVLIHL